jgi:esterase/lipase superfamily enzyme
MTLKDQLNEKIKYSYDKTEIVKINFATLRKTNGFNPSCTNAYFTNQFDKEKFGSCKISVPENHEIGTLDQDAKGNLNDYFQIQNHQSIQSLDNLIQEIKQNSFDEVIVFIHGFNVKFEEAILRAAQIKYDLKFSGELILYTWPAGADEGIINSLMIKSTYLENKQNAENSITHFQNFLEKISTSGKKIHIITHSMGHQMVIPAINKLYEVNKKQFLNQVIFNAPDFDSNQFKSIYQNISKSSERVTIYCSPGDNALLASSKVNSNPRVGSCQKFDGIDMINVNPVDAPVMGIAGLGHGYYSSRAIITDLHQVLLGVDARKRLFIRSSGEKNGENFVLRR